MIKRYSRNKLTWIDLESPTREEIRGVMDEYDIHPLAAGGLLLATQTPKIENYGDFIYMVIHFPAWKHSHKETMQEVDFLLGKDVLITARYENIDAIDRFARIFEVNSTLEKELHHAEHAGVLFCHLMQALYQALSSELDFVRDSLIDIEKKIFEGCEKEMVFAMSRLSRELLSFKHATVIHSDLLKNFGTLALPLFKGPNEAFFQSVLVEYAKIEKTVSGHMESLTELRETNNSLLETKQNTIIQKLTIITFITSIVAIFGALLQIDMRARPIVGIENDFWVILGLIVVASGVMLAFFKWKKWF